MRRRCRLKLLGKEEIVKLKPTFICGEDANGSHYYLIKLEIKKKQMRRFQDEQK